MKISQPLILVLSSCLLTACMEPALIIGQRQASISSEEVVVYYMDRPRCEYVTIAHIQANGGYFSLASMLANMRREAAEVGANGLYVLHTQQLEVKEYLGTAKAIRCLPVLKES